LVSTFLIEYSKIKESKDIEQKMKKASKKNSKNATEAEVDIVILNET
jgi:hypothetical protein